MRMRHPSVVVGAAAACAALGIAREAGAHGFAGDRFFPPTLATDDPFAVDELALPTFSWSKNPGGGGSLANHEYDYGFEFDKEIFPRFALGVNDTYVYQRPSRGPSVHGWGNVALTAKYVVGVDDVHEFILSVGLESDLGRTGDAGIGADDFCTLVPKLYFGKGFGDLPDSLGALKPFAVTGELAQSFPFSAQSPNVFQGGFAVEYSLPYLQQNVRDVGLPHPLRDLIPLVEFSMDTPENRAGRWLTSGTVNPGVLWETPYFQLGAEANVPINSRSGAHVGFTVQAWIYIDDIFPRTFGRPLFGGQP